MSFTEKLGLLMVIFGLWLAGIYPQHFLEYGLLTALLGAVPFVAYRET